MSGDCAPLRLGAKRVSENQMAPPATACSAQREWNCGTRPTLGIWINLHWKIPSARILNFNCVPAISSPKLTPLILRSNISDYSVTSSCYTYPRNYELLQGHIESLLLLCGVWRRGGILLMRNNTQLGFFSVPARLQCCFIVSRGCLAPEHWSINSAISTFKLT
jgi:hypothetical protein